MDERKEYVEKQVVLNDVIYMDTNCLMYINDLQKFIHNYKDIFLAESKKIVIIGAVMEELAKLSCSKNLEKQKRAKQALEIMMLNQELFYIENLDVNEERSIFADPAILNRLLGKRREYKQLLISNDRDLTTDAFKLNNIESFDGNRINVCFLTYEGNLQMCDCARKESIKCIEDDKFSQSTDEANGMNQTCKVEKNKSFFEKWGMPVGSFALGVLVTLGSKSTMNYIGKQR